MPGTGNLAAAVSFAGHIYCPDATAGIVYEFDGSGKLVNQIRISGAGGALELEVREDHLFINAPDGSTARVVDEKHVVKDVNKYENGVLGADPPPPQPSQPAKPVKTVPGKPQSVAASAGDASAVVTWRKAADNGAAITKYVIEGGPQPITVGAKQRSVEIKGLTNAQPYKFTVYAVNSVGAGPKATSPVVTPTADVPDAPTSASAKAKPDGTVEVAWPAANGQGRKIISYTVTSVAGGVQAPIGSVTGTTMTIAKGSLTYGTQYAFTVVAVNDKNAGSKASPASNTIVPFAAPGPPRNVGAATVTDQRGSIRVTWRAAEDNGRKIDKYVVDAGKGPQDVTGTTVTLNGFADDTPVEVTVHAVNEAGNGPDVKAAARTIGTPAVTIAGGGADYTSLNVTFAPNNKGGAATCQLLVNRSDGTPAGSASAGCATAPLTLTVGGLWPNNTYNLSVSITTAAGTATGTATLSTFQLRFTVICPNNSSGYCNGGVYAYQTPSQSGTAANPSLRIGATGTPQCHTANNPVIDATPWGAKKSNEWLKFSYGGRDVYFPWAWARLDGGDNLGLIPRC